jgi:trk system potassium uptake protein TrkH
MHFRLVQRILGLLLIMYSSTMLVPVAVSVYFADGQAPAFIGAFAIILTVGLIAWIPTRRDQRELRLRDGFLVAAVFWLAFSAFSAVPLLLTSLPQLSLADAIFEATSGVTATGSTILTSLDGLPASLLYYRAQLHWLGGMGIIVLAVAILPMLGIGGMQLYRAETPGPMKDSKLTPRITETAKALWLIYAALTALCVGAYWSAGMSLFDAVCHGFSTVATGGFSTHNASFGWFNSPLIEAIAIAFMFLSGTNFALHFIAWRSRGLKFYWRDPEFRTYLLLLSSATLLATVLLVAYNYYTSVGESLRYAAFHAVSLMTSSGFTATAFDQWPGALPLMMILLGFIGGCAGSTAGGMKVVRWLLLFNQSRREVKRLVHPAAEIPVHLGDSVIPQRVVDAVWGFCVAYIFLFGIMLLVLVGSGLDQITAFSALAASINNMGPGLGQVAATFTDINDLAKWVCSLAMIFGRLEVFTLLVLFSPTFWRS